MSGEFSTILADPPWQFSYSSGEVSPEHKYCHRYETMPLDRICSLPVKELAAPTAHLYLWATNAMLPEALQVMQAWGFQYKTNIVWRKVRVDGELDRKGNGFYYRGCTELLLFGVRGKRPTVEPIVRQPNIMDARRREHSRKPEEFYELIEAVSQPRFLELFARHPRGGWTSWGNEIESGIQIVA